MLARLLVPLLSGLIVALLMEIAPAARAEDCPTNTLSRVGLPPLASWNTVSGDTIVNDSWYSIRAAYDWSRDSLDFGLLTDFVEANLDARERFRIVGPAYSTVSPFTLKLRVNGTVSAPVEDLLEIATGRATVFLNDDALGLATKTHRCQAYSCNGSIGWDTTIVVPVSVPTSAPFEVRVVLYGYGFGQVLSRPWVDLHVRLRIEDLPPGAFLIRCHSDSIPPELVAAPEAPHRSLRFRAMAPNPTSGPVEVRFETGAAGEVTLRVFDVNGRVVESSILDRAGAQVVTTVVNRERQLAPGTYFVQIRRGAVSDVRTVTIAR